MTNDNQPRPADATGNWVDRYAPAAWRPFLRLARFDRPIGSWLLLWPCWWSLGLAGAAGYGDAAPWPDPLYLVLFLIGALVMRGAGCTYNDIVDKDFDAQVARTRQRPIPSGAVSVPQAWMLLIALCLIGLAVLLMLPMTAILLGVLSLALVAIYPFAKRFTYWPQLFLGLAFNWGALMGWAAGSGALAPPAVVLYAGGIFWTLFYDTIYAHQDKEDDLLIGVKSTALKLGERTKPALILFGTLALLGIGVAGWMVAVGPVFYLGLLAGALHMAWQVRTLDMDDGANCLRRFKSNHHFGALIFAGIVLSAALRVMGA